MLFRTMLILLQLGLPVFVLMGPTSGGVRTLSLAFALLYGVGGTVAAIEDGSNLSLRDMLPVLIGGLWTAVAYRHWRHPRYPPPPGCCKKCRYDLTGNISGICPECGTPVASQEQGTKQEA